MKTLFIRDAQAKDLEQILAIYNDAVVKTTAVYDEKARSLQEHFEWFAKKQAAHFPVLVAVENDEVLGYCSYGTFRAWPGFNQTVESSVYVEAKHHGKGIAMLLMKELIERAKGQSYHCLIAGIDGTNEASLKLHQKLGFTQVGHLKEVGRKFGQWLDLIFMQLLLK